MRRFGSWAACAAAVCLTGPWLVIASQTASLQELRLSCGDRDLVVRGDEDGAAVVEWQREGERISGAPTMRFDSNGQLDVRCGDARCRLAFQREDVVLSLGREGDAEAKLALSDGGARISAVAAEGWAGLGIAALRDAAAPQPYLSIGAPDGPGLRGLVDAEGRVAEWVAMSRKCLVGLRLTEDTAGLQIEERGEDKSEPRGWLKWSAGSGSELGLISGLGEEDARVSVGADAVGAARVRTSSGDGRIAVMESTKEGAQVGVAAPDGRAARLIAGARAAMEVFVNDALCTLLGGTDDSSFLRLSHQGSRQSMSAVANPSGLTIGATDADGEVSEVVTIDAAGVARRR